MTSLEIFRSGRHTDAHGSTVRVTDADLDATVAAYDPELSEAPLVVGHPRDNAPAYGWVGSLARVGSTLEAEPRQVDPAFAELVAAGRFKKRSASFYLPSSPRNPVPGVYYLRHVGFLGAAPPAVKGLRDVQFAEGEEGVVEFSDDLVVRGVLARLFRSLRDHLIGTAGHETADRVLPAWDCEALEDQARHPEPEPEPLYTEPEEDAMSPEELQARIDAAVTEALTRRAAEFSEREAGLSAREAALAAEAEATRRAGLAAWVAARRDRGQIPPAWERAGLVAFLEHLPHADVVEFAEGAEGRQTPLGWMQAFLDGLPAVVDLSEVVTPDTAPPHGTGAAAEQLDRLVADKRAADHTLSYTEAFHAVQREHPDLVTQYLDETRGA